MVYEKCESGELRILYILSSFNIFGGTPKKTLDLMRYFSNDASLYVYREKRLEFKAAFESTGGKIYEGYYGWNFFRHLRTLLKIIDNDEIKVIQTQFPMGEMLGYLIKLLRPDVKVIVAFVGPFKPSILKSIIAKKIYEKVDAFVYISDYVRSEKVKQFPILENRFSKIIYNGAMKREDNGEAVAELGANSLLTVSSLLEWKNIQLVVEAMNILVNKRSRDDIDYYVAGKGGATHEKALREMIVGYGLESNVHLLGPQKNIGALLERSSLFLHPSYSEGFGIAVIEAMLSAKPIIVSDSGALPELIEDKLTGYILPSDAPCMWADAIEELLHNKQLANNLGENARKVSVERFSAEKFFCGYQLLYADVCEDKND